MANFISDSANIPGNPPGFMAVSTDGLLWDLIPLTDVQITGIFQVVPDWSNGQSGTPGSNYPYATKTILCVTRTDSNIQKFELQDVKGGDLVVYNGGTKAHLQSAIQTVGGWKNP